MPADLTPTAPRTGDGVLELMARPIFGAGLSWEIVGSTWHETRTAFERFSVRKVADYRAHDIARIVETPGVIGNERKVQSVIGAARHLQKQGRRHGSVRKWLDGCIDHQARLDALTEIPGVGPWGAYYVLAKCGYPVPPWAG